MNEIRDIVNARWRGETPIYVIGLALMALCIGLLAARGIAPSFGATWVNTRLFGLCLAIVIAVDAARQLYIHRPDSPIALLKARYSGPEFITKALAGLPMLAVAIILLPFFSKMKSAIPLFNDYTWDNTFVEWDRAIFFGYDAWEVIQPVLGFPVVTAFLAFLYHVWILLLYPGVLFFAFGKMGSDLRRQFFLTYVLSWSVIGGAMATWLASVGPVFVGPLLGDTRFDEQMAYLRAANEQIPILVLPVQEMLLERYASADNGLGSGITAMPSMHVAIAFLFWIAMRQISPRLGMFFAAFFAITWVSSVHLAYHYAVDGLVSVIAVSAIWWGSRRIITAWDRFLEARGQAALRTNTVPAE